MTPGNPTCVGAHRRPSWPRRLLAALAAVLMALPGAAYPISLSHLLRLPLEELLRLEITASKSATRPRLGTSSARPVPSKRGAA